MAKVVSRTQRRTRATRRVPKRKPLEPGISEPGTSESGTRTLELRTLELRTLEPLERTPSVSSRRRLVAAAAAEFAARGFAGASVDRIARGARLNKAMIYYHFTSKAALYREILHDMFDAVARRVDGTARSTADPADKIRAFVEAIALEADARPHFPPIWFREIAEGGAHVDGTTVTHIAAVVKTLVAIIREGVAAGRFRPVNPLLVHAGIVGPLLLYFASAGIRKRLERAGVRGAGGVDRADVVAHVQRVALSTLEGRAS